MNKKITKGMILAAGLGTRLRPLTNKLPKPLVEVGGKKLIEYNIELLKGGGISEIVINLHHLGTQIKEYLGDGTKYDVKIVYSWEPEILGTGGGIKRVEEFFCGEPFAVTNGDIIADVNLNKVIEFHFRQKSVATLVLRPLANGESYTPIEVDEERLTGFGKGNMMYTGVQIVEPKVLAKLKEGTFSSIVQDAYIPLLQEGKTISAYIHKGSWTDIGTLERLEEVKKRYL